MSEWAFGCVCCVCECGCVCTYLYELKTYAIFQLSEYVYLKEQQFALLCRLLINVALVVALMLLLPMWLLLMMLLLLVLLSLLAVKMVVRIVRSGSRVLTNNWISSTTGMRICLPVECLTLLNLTICLFVVLGYITIYIYIYIVLVLVFIFIYVYTGIFTCRPLRISSPLNIYHFVYISNFSSYFWFGILVFFSRSKYTNSLPDFFIEMKKLFIKFSLCFYLCVWLPFYRSLFFCIFVSACLRFLAVNYYYYYYYVFYLV